MFLYIYIFIGVKIYFALYFLNIALAWAFFQYTKYDEIFLEWMKQYDLFKQVRYAIMQPNIYIYVLLPFPTSYQTLIVPHLPVFASIILSSLSLFLSFPLLDHISL